MKRFINSLTFFSFFTLAAFAQERMVREIPPEGLVKAFEMPFAWADARTILLRSGDRQQSKYLAEDIITGKRTPSEPPALPYGKAADYGLDENAQNSTLSPDGKYVAYTLENDLYTKELATGNIRRFTFDGSQTILNGYASWVYYEEILGRSSNYRSFWWSPDSRRLAFFRCDDTCVPMFPIYVADGQHGYLEETRYPKAGDTNPQVRVGVVSLEENSEIVWADFDPSADQYFGQPFWTPDGESLLIQWMNRDQNRLKLYSVNPSDGTGKIIYSEEQTAWLDWIAAPIFFDNDIIMVRDFESWQQIYMCSTDGSEFRKLTDGNNWGIVLHGIDPKGKNLFFSARREVSTRSDVYTVPLEPVKNVNKPGIRRLTSGDYHFTNILFSPDYKYFTALFSNVSTPTQAALFNVKKGLVRILGDSKGDEYDRLLSEGCIPQSQMHFITTDDGFTLPAVITFPIEMEEGRQYPVIVSIYGGPDNGSVMDRWSSSAMKYHWAKKGVIQIAMDHRGSGHCGKRGLDMMYRNLGKWEIHDYKLWIDYLREKECIDSGKVGITGYSYGGYMTALAVCTAGDYFPYGIAGAGVYDWSFYDTHYTERFMDTPEDNPEGYKNGSVLERCGTYGSFGPSMLMITHGTSDDNVHFQNALRLVNELMKTNKQFRFMMYPGQRHGYRGYQGVFSADEDLAFWTRYLLTE
jgi:dipeptidyl-peptidase-4